jgi:hypothetical protein
MSLSSSATAQRRQPGDLRRRGWPETQEHHAASLRAGADAQRQGALGVTDETNARLGQTRMAELAKFRPERAMIM